MVVQPYLRRRFLQQPLEILCPLPRSSLLLLKLQYSLPLLRMLIISSSSTNRAQLGWRA